LIRISYGPFQLGTLKAGGVEEIRPKILRDQLGMDRDFKPVGNEEARPDGPRATAKPGVKPAPRKRRDGPPKGRGGPNRG
jgi:23S rRNA pseudouridine2605 synthase